VDSDDSRERMMKELTLLLLYLASWEEEPFQGAPPIHRAWKAHRFEILDALEEEGLLRFTRGAKSLGLTEAGIDKARALERKYADA